MRTRPLARRAGLDGFVTFFTVLESQGVPSDPAALLSGRPVDLGLDFTFRPSALPAGDGRLTLGCVLTSERAQEVELSLGTFRGAAWQCGESRGQTLPPGEALDIRAGTGRIRLSKGANGLILRLEPKEVSALACLRIVDAAKGVRVGIPDGVSNDPDAGATPEFAALNRAGELHAREGMDGRTWRRALRDRWEALLSIPGTKGRGALRVLGETEDKGHRRLTVEIDTPLGRACPADLLVPKDVKGRVPGVIALHGHGPGRGRVSGQLEADEHRQYGLQLVKCGYVVLAPDIRNFGERSDPLAAAGRYTRDPCDVQFLRGFAAGILPAQAEACEWRAWVDALAAHPSVDPERLGVLGLSLGGRTTGLIAALDARVKAAVVSGALNTMRERVLYGQGCVKYLVPGLLSFADLPDLYALAAPRAVFFELGANDGTSPEIFAQEAWRRISAGYAAAGAPNAVGLHVFDGGHFFSGERSLPWLEEKLRE